MPSSFLARANKKKVLLTERFDEGLALLQKMLGWEPIDMTYCKMLQTKKGEKRWDGKPLQNVPKASELPPEVSAKYSRSACVSMRPVFLFAILILLFFACFFVGWRGVSFGFRSEIAGHEIQLGTSKGRAKLC